MNIGRLRHHAEIFKPVRTRDQSGGVRLTYAKLMDKRVDIEPMSGLELFNAQQINPMVTHRVRARYTEAIKSDMRIIHRGRVLEIMGPPVNERERRRSMKMFCKEVTT